ncbi:hypothetical protein D9619_004073 [Psilocybe cf. subviscida]|uniref:Uncharacterized protein n=1 Tax=Psilocybe cf. subviscida TaxID=2480587 RepID=A0A8H5BQJ3_9AGAR|nr:hypothetical protein D9619_004073 [Psilocybe cf. subviscida]
MEMEVQTDTVEEEVEVSLEPSCSPSSTPKESMASSSSVIVPPIPKPSTKHLADQFNEPRAYNQVSEADKEEREWWAAADMLKKWHNGLQIPLVARRSRCALRDSRTLESHQAQARRRLHGHQTPHRCLDI